MNVRVRQKMPRELGPAPWSESRTIAAGTLIWGTVMSRITTAAYPVRCAFLALAALGGPTAAWAQDAADYDRMLVVAETQSVVTQRMSVEALLVALNIDREPGLEHLQSSRTEFDRALTGFRDGDPMLLLRPIADPDLLGFVEEAGRHWVPMNAVIGDCLSGTALTAAHVEIIAEASQSLQDAFVDLADGLRERSKIDGSYSMLGTALETAGRTSLLSQQMTKEFLLVAYGHQPGRYRSVLRQTAEEFQNGLRGLLDGDIDRLLLAAPTPAIRTQLLRVGQIWENDYRPLIERAISEGDLNAGAVARMAQVNPRLLHEIELAAGLYRQL